MKKLLLLLLLIVSLCLACQKRKEENKVTQEVDLIKDVVTDSLYVLATDDFFNLSLTDSLSQRFMDESQTKLIWENGGDKKEIIDRLAESNFQNYPDLILGLSNVFLTELDSLDIFLELPDIFFSNVRSNNNFDKQRRFLPYQYSYLALIKKTSDRSSLPTSFGVMQKEEYFDKIIISDAISTEIGRALFNNIEGIFKFHGYAACWNRIKGALYRITDTEEEAFDLFWDNDDKYIFQVVTKVIEGYEAGYSPTMAFTYLTEGSYKLIHSTAITQRCRNKTKAEVFLLWLHKAEIQSLIVKSTNWYPIVETATKSQGHRIIDYPDLVMNSKINQKVVAKYLADWLDYWKIYREKF